MENDEGDEMLCQFSVPKFIYRENRKQLILF